MKKKLLFLTALIISSVLVNGQAWTIYDNSNANLGIGTYKAIEINQNGDIWVGGSYTGLSVYNGSTWNRYTSSNSNIAHNDINDIVIDANGDIWCGTYQGISVFNGSSFTTYDTSNTAMNGQTIYTLRKDNNNDIWIASRNGSFGYEGATIYNGSTWTNLTGYPSQMLNKEFSDFDFSSSNEAWIACNNGVGKYASSSFTYYTPAASIPISQQIEIASNGDVWVGGFDALAKFNGSSWSETPNTSYGFNANTLYYDIYEDGNYLWIGCSEGFLKIDKANSALVANYNSTNSPLDDNCVTDIAMDQSGVFWLATTIGIVRFDESLVGINEFELDNIIEAYPNPTNGIIYFNYKENVSFPMNLNLLDVTGKLVNQYLINNSSQKSIDLSHLSKGIYVLKSSTHSFKKKIIIK